VTTRRAALGLLGGGLLAGGLPAWARDRGAGKAGPSVAVALDDPAIRVTENLWIPMPDGTLLAARLFLPADADVRPTGVVLEYLPYRKRDGYRYRDDVAGAALAKTGIGFIRVDIRGTGESDGVMIDEYMPVEQQDALDVLAWIARQTWCNGNLGMRGISYGSFTALQAAEKAPPSLKAIVSTCGTELRYVDDVHYRGGCLIQDQFDWAMEWQVVLRAAPDPQIVGQDRWRAMWQARLAVTQPLSIIWDRHQTLDGYWQNGSMQDYRAVKCAIFNVGGMQDCYVDSALRMMERAPVPQKALIGPWSHKWPGYPDPPGYHAASGMPSAVANGNPGPGVDWLPIEARWWRHWLLGEANGIMDEPRFWAFREDLPPGANYPHDTAGRWIGEDNWPAADIKPEILYMNKDGLAPRAGAQALLAHRTNLTIGFASRESDATGDPDTFWREQSGDDALCLCFDSEPLAQPLDVMGQPLLAIRVRADRPVAKLCCRLTEVMADGKSHYVSYGVLNLTHRASDSAPTPLKPGQDYDVALTCQFACYRFAAGSRIRVAVSETWWPVVWPSPELVTLHVTTGVSRLTLPTRPLRADDPAPPFTIYHERYASDRTQSPYDEGRLQGVDVSGPPEHRRYVLVTGSDQVAREKVPDIATVYGEAYRLERTIVAGDPTSAAMEAEAINTYDRPDWHIKLRAWCRCRCDATAFIQEETFEAWEGETLVYSKHWEARVPRVLV
jgi:putative CocE/NonD family hydrolase